MPRPYSNQSNKIRTRDQISGGLNASTTSLYEEEKYSVTTSQTGSRTTAQSHITRSIISNGGFLRPQRQPQLQTDVGTSGAYNKVLTSDLMQMMKSKQDIYKLLTVTGQKIVTSPRYRLILRSTIQRVHSRLHEGHLRWKEGGKCENPSHRCVVLEELRVEDRDRSKAE